MVSYSAEYRVLRVGLEINCSPNYINLFLCALSANGVLGIFYMTVTLVKQTAVYHTATCLTPDFPHIKSSPQGRVGYSYS